jgi:integrase
VFTTKDAALAHVARMEIAVRDGSYIDRAHGRSTFREYAEAWRTDQLHHRVSTVEQAESRLRLHAYPVIGGMQLAAIKRSDIQRLVNRAAERLAPSTVEVTYGYVATVFKSAVLDGMLARTPCVGIKLPEVVHKRVVPLLLPQVSKIRLAMPDRYQAAVTIAAASGFRQGELFGLTVDRLEGSCDNVVLVLDRQRGRKAGTWGPPKTKAGDRRVPIGLLASRALWRHLATYREGIRGHVFSTPRRNVVTPATAGDLWRTAVEGMGLGDRSGWHDLRHFHASLLIADGRSVPAVAERLGHKDQAETLATYSHLWPPDEDRAIAAVDAALAEL